MIGRVILCLLLAASLLPVQPAGAQQARLKAAMQLPVDHPLIGSALRRLKEVAEERSNNTLSIEIVDKGRLAGDLEMADAVASGTADIGITASQIFVLKAPALAILDLPFLFNFRALTDAAAKPGSEIRKLVNESMIADAGMRVLLWQPVGDMHFYSSGQDLADVRRLKGRRVAVPGKALEDFIVRCGGRPTTLRIDEFHDAIKDGEADTALMTLGGVRDLRLWKVQDTIALTTHAPAEFLAVINERRWQALSPEHRAIMTEAARIAEREGRARLAQYDAMAERFAEEKGVKLVHLTPDQVADWRACSADMVADYMVRNGERARRLMAAYARLRTDPCCSAGPGWGQFTRR